MCIDRWVDKEDVVYIQTHTHTHIHTLEYYLAKKNNEIMPFAATWMDLESIMLGEINQTEKGNTVWYHLYVESKKHKKLVNIIKKKQTHRYREHTNDYQWAEGRGEGQ